MSRSTQGSAAPAALEPNMPCTSGQDDPKPSCVLVIGMAGSGKTTLMQRLNAHLRENEAAGYLINLDPAVLGVPYSANIDIRDTVKYKNVMKQYNLGPNGGILTACNLFATRFDQVMSLLEKEREQPLEYVLVDTPGQIEIFTWSASGQIVTELLASSFPTCVAFVIDTPRCLDPQTFMSNMLQACSILYKTQLPLMLVFNKTDVVSSDFATEWMTDFEVFQERLSAAASYSSSLSRSLSMVLDEFYSNLTTVSVSALTGAGMDAFFEAVEACSRDYEANYIPMIAERKREREERERARQEESMTALAAELSESKGADTVISGKPLTEEQLSEELSEKAAL